MEIPNDHTIEIEPGLRRMILIELVFPIALLVLGIYHGLMSLKGGSAEHTGDPLPDRWSLNTDLEAVAGRWKIDPLRDLANAMPAAGAVG